MHTPVLAKEVVAWLPSRVSHVIDGTVGLGGHAALLLDAMGPGGRLTGFDRDARNLVLAKERLARFGDRVTLHHAPFSAMATLAAPADAILLDLGISSVHVDTPDRGFSFLHNGPLDMRFDTTQGPTAADLVNGLAEVDLEAILRRFGEEARAQTIAHAIVQSRRKTQFTTTSELAALIAAVTPRQGKLHPATKTFQALRIAVNDELGEVERGLAAAVETLSADGRLLVISFHSLEDRLIKERFRTDACLAVLTKKPITATREEIQENPRSRSAKLRVAQRRPV